MQNTPRISWVIALIFCSCSSELKGLKESENERKCVVIESRFVNDSIVSDETVEYYWYAVNDFQQYHFKKLFFVREYRGLIEEIYAVDSIKVDLSVDSRYEIKKIDNWPELYQKVKGYADQLLERTPEERLPEMIELIQNVVLDSAAIVDKNTQDIQVYFLVLQEFNLNSNSQNYSFIHNIEDSIETISDESIIDFNAVSSILQDLSFMADIRESRIHNSIIATRNLRSNRIMEITHLMRTVVGDDSIVKSRVMTFY